MCPLRLPALVPAGLAWRWLYPLMNQDIFSAFSMTEPQGGSDPSLFTTSAARDGEEWVINAELAEYADRAERYMSLEV